MPEKQMHLGVFVQAAGHHVAGWRHPDALPGGANLPLMRQIAAVAADSGREKLLARIACPTLVLHGDADPLLPIACGLDTARRIPGARFVPLAGMGHDLTPQLSQILLPQMVPFLQAAQKPPTT